MTGREVYQALRESRTGEGKLRVLRAFLQQNKDATGERLLQEAIEKKLPEGTLQKMANLLAGLPVDGKAKVPEGWDTDLDGPYSAPVPIHQTKFVEGGFADKKEAPGIRPTAAQKADSIGMTEHKPTTPQQPATIIHSKK